MASQLIAVAACGEGVDGCLHGGDSCDFFAVGEADLAGRVSADRRGGDVGVGCGGEREGGEQGDRQAGPAVGLLAQVGTRPLHAHALGLANRFRAAAGLEPGNSAIVSLATDDGAAAAMATARIAESARAGRLRLSFHISTSEADADHAIDTLRPHILPSHLATR